MHVKITGRGDKRNTGGIISAVFKSFKSLYQYLISSVGAEVAYNSTHIAKI